MEHAPAGWIWEFLYYTRRSGVQGFGENGPPGLGT